MSAAKRSDSDAATNDPAQMTYQLFFAEAAS